MNLRRRVPAWLAKAGIGTQLVTDRRRRMVLTAALGLILNLLCALYHGVLGVLGRSAWLVAMCAYYTILSTLRFSAVLCARRGAPGPCIGEEYFVMRLPGVLLALLSLVLAGVVFLSLSRNIAAKYGEITMITIAAYTFYKITAAIVRAVRQRKDPSPLLAVIRTIGYAEVAASVSTLQRSMLISFDGMSGADIQIMNALTGTAVCLFVLLLGITMILRGIRKGEALWPSQSL